MIYIHVCALILLIPYCVFILTDTWEVTPALPIIFLFIMFCMFLFLYLAACSDPGIIPRKPFLERDPQRFKRYLVDKPNSGLRFCDTCQVLRPKRSSHCSTCGNCVEVYDHHCGVIGHCIAKRNYRFFMLFLACVCLSVIMFIVNLVVFLISRGDGSVNKTVVIVIASVIGGIIGIPILAFLICHLVMLCRGTTTRELLKNIETDKDAEVENQWCDVDAPLIDFNEELTEAEARTIKEGLEEIASRNNPNQYDYGQNNPRDSPTKNDKKESR